MLGLQQAVAANSFHVPSPEVRRGNVTEALETADHVLEGGIHIGGQEHFYLETQACLVVPKGEDGEIEIFLSTQHLTSIQVFVIIEMALFYCYSLDVSTTVYLFIYYKIVLKVQHTNTYNN